MTKERYHQNRSRVFEIMGLNPEDKRYSCHHIIERSDYKHNKKFWDDSVPSGHFDIDAKGNLFPLKIEEHKELHRKIDKPQISPKRKRRKKRKRR